MIQNFISKLSPKEKKIAAVTAVFVLLALFDRLFLGPVMSRMHSLDEDIQKEENAIISDLRLLSYKERIIKENDTLRPYYAVDLKTEEEIIAAFLKRIEMLATQAHVNLIKVNPSEVRPQKGYVEYYASLEADGRLSDILRFMHSIDTADDLIKIVTVEMAPKRASAEEVKLNMSVVKVLVDLASIEQAKKILAGDMSAMVPMAGGRAAQGPGGSGGQGFGGAGGAAGGSGGQGSEGAGQPGTGGSGDLRTGGGAASEPGGAGATQAVSQRFGMKGGAAKKEPAPKKEEEVDEIKPSIFEKILEKRGDQE